MIMQVSPLAIQHINLAGIYQYTDELTGINISEIVAALHTAVDAALNRAKMQGTSLIDGKNMRAILINFF